MIRAPWILLVVLLASLAVAATVLATHAPGGVIVTDSQRGTLAEGVRYNLGEIKVQTKAPVDVVVQEVTFLKNGGNAGWHTHPGPVFVVVKSGTLSVWDEHCAKTTYSQGEVLFEAGPHHSMLVKNESATEDVRLYATYIVPVGANPLRTGEPHLCGMEE